MASTGSTSPAFDVASIRPSKAGGPQHVGPTPDGYSLTNTSLLVAILNAYVPSDAGDASYFTNDRVLAAPAWLRTERYDIDAKVDTTEYPTWHDPTAQKALLRQMLQALLAERCKLAVHREIREVSVYSLVVARNGPKLKAASPGEPHPGGMTLPDGSILVPGNGGRTFTFYNASMSALAVLLSNISGRSVQDHTGITGRYDFSIDKGAPVAADTPADEPSIFGLVQEQLGLRLQGARGQVEMLVIDHMERPTDN